MEKFVTISLDDIRIVYLTGGVVNAVPFPKTDQLTLSKSLPCLNQGEGADYADQLLHDPSDFQTFRHPCNLYPITPTVEHCSDYSAPFGILNTL